MSIRVNWSPSVEADIDSYIVQRADNLTGAAWGTIATIDHDLLGPNYDTQTSQFFYVDATGDQTKWYRLISVDDAAQQSVPSMPFQAVSTAPALPNVVSVDHNYGGAGALRYQTAGGVPIESAVVRVYLKTEFDLGNTETPLAVTLTNSSGNWVNPISLTTGFTYTVQFAKESLYGPDKTDIVV